MQSWKGKCRAYSSHYLATLPDISTPTTSSRGAVIANAHAQLARRQPDLGRGRGQVRSTLEGGRCHKFNLCGRSNHSSCWRSSIPFVRRYATSSAALAEVEDDSPPRSARSHAESWARKPLESDKRWEAIGIGVEPDGHISRAGRRRTFTGRAGRAAELDIGTQRDAGMIWNEEDSFGSDGLGDPSSLAKSSCLGVSWKESSTMTEVAEFESNRLGIISAASPEDEEVPGAAKALSTSDPADSGTLSIGDGSEEQRKILQMSADVEGQGAGMEQLLDAEALGQNVALPQTTLALVPLTRLGVYPYQPWRTRLLDSLIGNVVGRSIRSRSTHLETALEIFQDCSDADRRAMPAYTLCNVIDIILVVPREDLLRLRDGLDEVFYYCMGALTARGSKTRRGASRAQTGWLRGRYLAKTVHAALRSRMRDTALAFLKKCEVLGITKLGSTRTALDSGTGDTASQEIATVLSRERDPVFLESLTVVYLVDRRADGCPDPRILELRMRALLRLGKPGEAGKLYDRYVRLGLNTRLVAIGLRLCASIALGDVRNVASLGRRWVEAEAVWTTDHLRLLEVLEMLSHAIAKGQMTEASWRILRQLRPWNHQDSKQSGQKRASPAVFNAMVASGLALGLRHNVKDLLAKPPWWSNIDESAAALLESANAKDSRVLGNAATYAILLNACARESGNLTRVRSIWEDYQVHSSSRDARVLAALIRALIGADSHEVARDLLQNRVLGIEDEWDTMDMPLCAEALNPMLAKLSGDAGLSGALQVLSWFAAASIMPDSHSLSSIVTRIGAKWKMSRRRQVYLREYLALSLRLDGPDVATVPQPPRKVQKTARPERTAGFARFADPSSLQKTPSPQDLYSEVERRHGGLNASYVVRIIQSYLSRGALELAVSSTLEVARRDLQRLDDVTFFAVRILAYEHEQRRCQALLWGLQALGRPFAMDRMIDIASGMEKQGYYHMAANFLLTCFPLSTEIQDDVMDSVRFRLLMRDGQHFRAISQVARRDRPLSSALRDDVGRFLKWHEKNNRRVDNETARKLRALMERPYVREEQLLAEIRVKVGQALKSAMRSGVAARRPTRKDIHKS